MRAPHLRRVETANSVWLFDPTEKTYLRLPRVESPEHPHVAYSGDWEPYEDLIPSVDWEGQRRLTVVRPVPFGEGQLRQTGQIINDTDDE